MVSVAVSVTLVMVCWSSVTASWSVLTTDVAMPTLPTNTAVLEFREVAFARISVAVTSTSVAVLCVCVVFKYDAKYVT